MTSQTMTFCAAGAFGVLAAVGTTIVMHHFRAPAASTHEASSTSAREDGREEREVVIRGPDPARLVAVERGLAELRSQREAEEELAEEEEAPPPDPEEEQRLTLERIEKLEKNFENEPADPEWAPAASGALRDNLGQVARSKGFSLVEAECHSNLCRASLRWSSFDEAVKSGSHLAQGITPGLNCTRSIYLTEPSDRSAPYTASFFMDCAEQRAGLVDDIPTARVGQL